MRNLCGFIVFAVILAAGVCHAQTADYHLGVGARVSPASPPEFIDMSWASGESCGPAAGKNIQMFVLAGLFGRQGQGESRELPEAERVGNTRILMFEDGRWQPLRPVGIRYGLELPFAMRMAWLHEGETIGVVVAEGANGDYFSKAAVAMKAVPCEFVACVRLNRNADVVPPEFSTMREIDVSDIIKVEKGTTWGVEAMADKGKFLADYVWNQLQKNKDR